MKHSFIALLLISTICSQETIAVLPFDVAGITTDEATILIDRLGVEIYKLGTYTVIERSRIDEVLKEQGFQQMGCTTSECAVEVGMLLGVQKMVTGTIGRLGSLYTISARLVDVESGTIEGQVSKDVSGSIEILLLTTMAEVAAELSGTSNIKKPAVEARTRELAAEKAVVDEKAMLARVIESVADKTAAVEKAAAELAAAELVAAEARANKLFKELAAAEKITAEARAKLLAAQLAEDCQKVHNLSQELYRAGKLSQSLEILETTLRMEGCDEELNSKAFYLIAWNYANNQGNLGNARALYQKVVHSFSSGLKYVDKAEKSLAGYSLNDLAEAAYDKGRFGGAIALREQVVKDIGFDKELRAINQYLIGYIYQYKLKELDKAKQAYRKVGNIHPQSDYVVKAKQKLETL